jgi:hypothetical protein
MTVTALGLLLSKIRNIPSFDSLESATYSPPVDKKYINEAGAFGDVMPNIWRQWVAKHSNGTDTAISIYKVEPVSQHTDWGCGISIQLLFQRRTQSERIPSTTKAFFKASYADMTHYDAESHLREIKAYYLDRILKTNVVLPCVGYHLDRQQLVEDDKNWKFIQENHECVNEKLGKSDATSNHGTDSFEGSIMLWMYDLNQVEKEKIVKSARLFDSSGHDVGRQHEHTEELESAMNYAIFHYLGACMKSEHNHFSYRKKRKNSSDGSTKSARQYVAIDNDRCMTPEAVFSNRDVVPDLHFNRIQLWEQLVFGRICLVSHHKLPVIRVVREAAAAAGKGVDDVNSGPISSHLLKALENDVLSSELANSQPEAFSEIDKRINRLGEYIQKNCPQEAT